MYINLQYLINQTPLILRFASLPNPPYYLTALLILPYITELLTLHTIAIDYLLTIPMLVGQLSASTFGGNYLYNSTFIIIVAKSYEYFILYDLATALGFGANFVEFNPQSSKAFDTAGMSIFLNPVRSNYNVLILLETLTPQLSIPTSYIVISTFGFKFIIIILLLIFVRGGIPRYRYDFLTKMGWFKYFSWVLLFFSLSFILYILFS